MRKTKIIATIGPASSNPETIARLLEAGMDVARLNFSHGTYDDHARAIAMLRTAAKEAGRPLAILQDLQGPKIRTGTLAGGQPVLLRTGERFTITTRPTEGSASLVSTTYEMLPRDVCAGDRILVSDGLIELHVLGTGETEVHTEVVVGGELRQKQGINLPGVNVSAPSLTAKDVADLEFGLEQNVDYVALSFVRSAADITDIKKHIAAAGKNVPVVAKIEKPEALNDLTEIVRLSDALMVARGDLGVEIETERVPPVQKLIIREANEAGVPVITATQMLDSMMRNPRPTRAEASDVANAIFDGTDAVMLSGETASGSYPVEAVQMMGRIALAAEKSIWHGRKHPETELLSIDPQDDIADSISAATRAIAEALPIHAIVALTLTGNTARLVSRQRPRVPILACTPWESTYRRLNLMWGLKPVMVAYADRLLHVSKHVYTTLLEGGFAGLDDMVILIGGHPLATLGTTNFLKVVRVRELDGAASEG